MAAFRWAINSGNGDDFVDGTGDYARHPIVNYENVFLNNDVDDFQEGISRATTSAELARLLGTQRKRKRKRKSGPAKKSMKIKVYYLPDASELPSKFLASDPLLKLHMQQCYGKKTLLQFAIEFN